MAISHSPGRTRRRVRAPRNTLNRERVLEAAVDLLDHAGPAEFTMRRLAKRLGVATMAVYSHFSGKDEIIDAVRLRLLAEAELPARQPPEAYPGPREEIRGLCHAVYRLLADHPSALRLLAERPVRGDEGTQFGERVRAALSRAGLDRDRAVRAHTALTQFTIGASLWARPDAEQFGYGLDALVTGLLGPPTSPTPARPEESDDRTG
jgi:AcrR family transcriptional regulator